MNELNPESPAWRRPQNLALAAAVMAIAITATMDATGYADFSAFPLALVLALFWFLQKNGRVELGYCLGRGKSYALPFLYPLAVLPTLGLLAYMGGDLALAELDLAKSLKNVALVTFGTFVMALITEEGLYRGWIWASLVRSGADAKRVLLLTSFAFMLWHISFATIAEGYILPLATLPVFLGNVFLLGVTWGLMRLASGSLMVASLAHGIWNGMVYVLFGVANESGMFGITATEIYGPETGQLGLAVNAVVTLVLWRYVMRKQ